MIVLLIELAFYRPVNGHTSPELRTGKLMIFGPTVTDISLVCQTKAAHDNWGKRRIYKHLLEGGKEVSEPRIGHYLESFFFLTRRPGEFVVREVY